MFDLSHFEARKKELTERFDATVNDIKNHQKAIEQLIGIQHELRGAHAENEANIKKLTEVKDGEANSESTQENKV
jgi:hypothetical protein